MDSGIDFDVVMKEETIFCLRELAKSIFLIISVNRVVKAFRSKE